MADNYPEAAWKHVTDSEALLAAKRYDGAGYLAGYAVECTLKTLIWVESGRGRGGHNLTHLSGTAVHLLSLPGQRTASYVRHPNVTGLQYGPTGWRETLRYEAAGVVSKSDAEGWLAEAKRLCDEVIIPMKLDGVIP